MQAGTGALADYMSAIMQWAPMRIVWSGGEPMLQRNIGDFMAITKQHGCVNILTTNGTIAPRPALAPLTDWADISLHGVDTATFRATTSLDLFGSVINNIARYTKVFTRTSASLVLVRRMVNRSSGKWTMWLVKPCQSPRCRTERRPSSLKSRQPKP